ncbi:hypothetical protein BDN72DRAFT_895104 [Pluteus cervinus]|uniref:Uncharacterized protein n=1 Tax=Pluteus cervinus TaxID=181527 RepID=A0ACD3B3C9_9AGAR|nr:hypothetical protein BDN72DRAFT_895104 [Pluteus cervinus]
MALRTGGNLSNIIPFNFDSPDSIKGELPGGEFSSSPLTLAMLFKSFALLLATFAASALADSAVFYCTDINWGGNCHHSPPITADQQGVCHNMKGDVAQFNDAISSFGPDGDLSCTVFKDFDCPSTDSGFQIVHPGWADLRTVGLNDVISSYQCYIEQGNCCG